MTKYLFVTWRLHGSLPVTQPDVFYATAGHAFAAEDRALARGDGTLWLSDTRVARQVVEVIRIGESRKLYELNARVVMPNHVHLLILEPFSQHESYDHWVRNEKEFGRVVAYIEDNSVSAGLAARAEGWPWSSAARES